VARFLHKTTRQWHDDDGTGDLGPDYLRNPDLSAVVGVPQSRWVVDGDAVRAPNEQELAAFLAAELIEAKVAKCRAIDGRSAALISTAAVVVNGESISASHAAQTNMLALEAKRQRDGLTYPVEISATNGEAYQIVDESDFIRVSTLVLGYVKGVLDTGRALRVQVLTCSTVEAVAAVEDNR